jgi:hypothetical protein
MIGHRLLSAFAIAFIFLTSFPASADEPVIQRWYEALLAVDREGLSAVLAEDARIRLDDLGIEQTKAEFIASMDEWQGAVAGAQIRHKVEAAQGKTTTVVACYDFPENDILMRETFSISDGLITENTQATVAEDCASY